MGDTIDGAPGGRLRPALVYGATYAVRCPECGGGEAIVAAADYRPGTIGRCPACGGAYRLPQPLVPPYDGRSGAHE